jgi:hypothetical protein
MNIRNLMQLNQSNRGHFWLTVTSNHIAALTLDTIVVCNTINAFVINFK